MKIAIVGSGIEVFTCGHRLLDKNPNLEIHIFDEKAESGMYGDCLLYTSDAAAE